MAKQVKCKTLLGHNGLDFSINCLKSFVNKSEQEIVLQIFEDGTLTIADRDLLKSTFPNSSIVNKSDRDIEIPKKLKGHPLCLNYRNSTNYAQKLFDIMLYDEDDTLYIDSDIYFLKKFSLPELPASPVFMADTHNAYSFNPLEFFRIKFPILKFINSGFFYFPKKLYDLDFLELILGDKVIGNGLIKKIPWLEQTTWAFLAAKTGDVYYFDYDQIMMAQQVMVEPILENLTERSVAVHLVYALRFYIFDELKKLPEDYDNGFTYQKIELKKATSFLGKIDFAIERVRKTWLQKTAKGYLNKNNFASRKR